ncbi:hypothetical protein Aperf_G00000093900 [Anoplocephala perfoliata]
MDYSRWTHSSAERFTDDSNADLKRKVAVFYYLGPTIGRGEGCTTRVYRREVGRQDEGAVTAPSATRFKNKNSSSLILSSEATRYVFSSSFSGDSMSVINSFFYIHPLTISLAITASSGTMAASLKTKMDGSFPLLLSPPPLLPPLSAPSLILKESTPKLANNSGIPKGKLYPLCEKSGSR